MFLLKTLNRLLKRKEKILSFITDMIEDLEETNTALDTVREKAISKMKHFQQIELDAAHSQMENEKVIKKFRKLVE